MYKKARSCKKVPPHLTKYTFSVQHGGPGNRKWATVVCRPREVERLHAVWLDKMITIIEEEASAVFFENLSVPYLEHCRRNHSTRWYRHESYCFHEKFLSFFGILEVRSIRRRHIEDYIETQVGIGVSPASINKQVVALSGFFSWMIRRDIYERNNPCIGMRVNAYDERYIHLTGDQIVEVVKASRVIPELEVVVMIALFAGLRRGEIMGLMWKSVNLDHRRIYLGAKETKSRRRREVPLPLFLVEFLRDIKKDNGRVVECCIQKIELGWRRVRKSLSFDAGPGLGPLRLHDLRHAYAQALRDAGIDLQDIGAFLGHSSVTTTEGRYAQSGGFRGEEKVDRIAEIIPIDKLRKRTG